MEDIILIVEKLYIQLEQKFLLLKLGEKPMTTVQVVDHNLMLYTQLVLL